LKNIKITVEKQDELETTHLKLLRIMVGELQT